MMDAWTTLGFIGSALLSFVGVGLATALAHRTGTLAQPGVRASHSVATPTGGGVGLVAALVVLPLLPGFSSVFSDHWRQAVVPGVALLGIVGWLDDYRGLPAAARLVVQLAVSSWLLISLSGWGGLAPEADVWPPWLSIISLITLVWVMNAYNFMDGSNGMAGGQGVFTGLLLGVLMVHEREPGLAMAGFAVAGASLGFLPWNLPRPRVFLGDAGSVPLGFAIGALLVAGLMSGKLVLPVALLVLGVFLTDSSLTLLRRIIAGERWYTAHRKHVYQRLIAEGWTHNRVLGLYQAINLILILPAVVLGTMYPKMAWPLTGIVYMVMTTVWCIKSLKPGGDP